MSSVRRGLRVATVGAFVTVLVGWMTTPAAAHTLYAYHINTNSDRAWSDHSHLRVEDRECDGNGVYAEGYDIGGYLSVSDANGCESGYSHADGTGIYQFRVCERTKGCSDWVYD
jgi:hypothetical protein